MKTLKMMTLFLGITLLISCNNSKESGAASSESQQNVASEKVQNPVVKIIDFNATWCGPCKEMAPIIEKVEQKYTGKVAFEKVDVDEQSALANQYGIQSIPTLVYLDAQGKEITRTVGFLSENELEAKIKGLL